MKEKGFTLVELLGVIVVLAIIALIAVPTILGIIEKSRKGSLQNSGYGLVEAGTLYNAQYQNGSTVRFDINDNEVTSKEKNKLSYKGSIKEGTVLINNKGEVVVCINDGKYASYKNFKDNKVIVVDNKTCNIPENSNIVYLDNEATIDINIEDLVAEINTLKEKVNKLESEKSNQTDVTNSINNLTSTHNTDMNLLNNKLGNTDISSIGNGTITNSIYTMNQKVNSLLELENIVRLDSSDTTTTSSKFSIEGYRFLLVWYTNIAGTFSSQLIPTNFIESTCTLVFTDLKGMVHSIRFDKQGDNTWTIHFTNLSQRSSIRIYGIK